MTPRDYAMTLYRTLRDAGVKDTKSGISRFIASLRSRRALRLLPRILAALPAAAEAVDADRRVTVESARELPAKSLAAVLKAAGYGKNADVRTRVVPELIGGVRIRTRDGVTDASVTGRLEKLIQALRRAA